MKQILVFVLFASMLCWLMFSPVYKHVLIVRQAVLQKEVDLMLEIGANADHGYIDSIMLLESHDRLAQRGFNISKLGYWVQSTTGEGGTSPDSPVIRGDGILLEIAYPYMNLLSIDRLMGIPVPNSQSMLVARGMKMSEYIP